MTLKCYTFNVTCLKITNMDYFHIYFFLNIVHHFSHLFISLLHNTLCTVSSLLLRTMSFLSHPSYSVALVTSFAFIAVLGRCCYRLSLSSFCSCSSYHPELVVKSFIRRARRLFMCYVASSPLLLRNR